VFSHPATSGATQWSSLRHVLKRDGIWWFASTSPPICRLKWGKKPQMAQPKNLRRSRSYAAAPAIIARSRAGSLPCAGKSDVLAPQAPSSTNSANSERRLASSRDGGTPYSKRLRPSLQRRACALTVMSVPTVGANVCAVATVALGSNQRIQRESCGSDRAPLDHPPCATVAACSRCMLDMEREIDRFRSGDFKPMDPENRYGARAAKPTDGDAKTAGLKLSVLLERFIASKKRARNPTSSGVALDRIHRRR